ncbi:DUF5710 domain-containing protein [Brevibacillus porteri]|uniref:DUF5710 domain-containing protein n=1 Tax=Brevibacillus porteri TaxID=2126350 RepID=UPI00370C73F6
MVLNRYDLRVPFSEKDYAKSLGAKWEPNPFKRVGSVGRRQEYFHFVYQRALNC